MIWSFFRRLQRFTIRPYFRLSSGLGFRWLRPWLWLWFWFSIPPVARPLFVTRSRLCMFVMIFWVVLSMPALVGVVDGTGHFPRLHLWYGSRCWDWYGCRSRV